MIYSTNGTRKYKVNIAESMFANIKHNEQLHGTETYTSDYVHIFTVSKNF